MIVVAGSAPLQPAKIDEAKAAIAVVCAATWQEPGCISYDFSFDAADPCVMRVFEQWQSEDDLTAHLQLPHTVAFLGLLGTLVSGAPDVKRYIVSCIEPL